MYDLIGKYLGEKFAPKVPHSTPIFPKLAYNQCLIFIYMYSRLINHQSKEVEMNPFEQQEHRYKHGEKIKYYYSQFENMQPGFDNAIKVDIFAGDGFAEPRMYFFKYINDNGNKYRGRTKTVNGELWVALLEDN